MEMWYYKARKETLEEISEKYLTMRDIDKTIIVTNAPDNPPLNSDAAWHASCGATIMPGGSG